MFFESIKNFFSNNTNPRETSEILNAIQNEKNEEEIKKQMDLLWDLKGSDLPLEEAHDEHELLHRFHLKNKSSTKKENRQVFLKLNQIIKIAAVIVLILGIGTFYYSTLQKSEIQSISGKQNIELIEKSVPFGAKLTLTLSDGSLVKINSGSTIKYPKTFKNGKREIFLEGEAFFEVQRDEGRPFIVHSKNLQTTVLGTSFNVKAYKDGEDMSVAVVTGKVRVKNKVHNNEQDVILIPSEMVVLEGKEMEKVQFDEKKILSWKDNIILFEDASFEAVTKILERWYGVTFLIKKPNGVSGKFDGTFHNLSLQEVLEGLNYTTKFDFKIEDDIVTID